LTIEETTDMGFMHRVKVMLGLADDYDDYDDEYYEEDEAAGRPPPGRRRCPPASMVPIPRP
jgi:hypothetical protein